MAYISFDPKPQDMPSAGPRRRPTTSRLFLAAILAAGLAGCSSLTPPPSNTEPVNPGFSSNIPLTSAQPAKRPARARGAAQPVWDDPLPSASMSSAPSSARPDPAKILSGEWPEPEEPQTETTEETIARANAELASHALGYLGVRYRYGGSSPESGFDCSGLVGYVSRQVLGLNLPRRAEEISQVGEQIGLDDLEPGDLVFYNTLRRKFSHVGIYLGDGRFVHSPSAGGKVRIENMSMSYWKHRFNGARRLASTEAAAR